MFSFQGSRATSRGTSRGTQGSAEDEDFIRRPGSDAAEIALKKWTAKRIGFSTDGDSTADGSNNDSNNELTSAAAGNLWPASAGEGTGSGDEQRSFPNLPVSAQVCSQLPHLIWGRNVVDKLKSNPILVLIAKFISNLHG